MEIRRHIVNNIATEKISFASFNEGERPKFTVLKPEAQHGHGYPFIQKKYLAFLTDKEENIEIKTLGSFKITPFQYYGSHPDLKNQRLLVFKVAGKEKIIDGHDIEMQRPNPPIPV